jgi:mRNA interferase RelE/StbE
MLEKAWSVELSKSTLKTLDCLGKRAASRILDRLEELEETENPLRHKDVRPLEGKLKGSYRLRVGEYRIIFELDSESRRIGLLAIVPRGKGY